MRTMMSARFVLLFVVCIHARSASSCRTYTDDSCPSGDRVKRGPDWKWGDQDGYDTLLGYGRTGTVTGVSSNNRWCRVTWDNDDDSNNYRVGYDGAHDLCLVSASTKNENEDRRSDPYGGYCYAKKAGNPCLFSYCGPDEEEIRWRQRVCSHSSDKGDRVCVRPKQCGDQCGDLCEDCQSQDNCDCAFCAWDRGWAPQYDISSADIAFTALGLMCSLHGAFRQCYVSKSVRKKFKENWNMCEGCADGGDASSEHRNCWILVILVWDAGFTVAKLFPGVGVLNECGTMDCAKISHNCLMTLFGLPVNVVEWFMVEQTARAEEEVLEEQDNSDTISSRGAPYIAHLAIIKGLEFLLALAYIVYDAATVDPPGTGTTALIVVTCLIEVLFIYGEYLLVVWYGVLRDDPYLAVALKSVFKSCFKKDDDAIEEAHGQERVRAAPEMVTVTMPVTENGRATYEQMMPQQLRYNLRMPVTENGRATYDQMMPQQVQYATATLGAAGPGVPQRLPQFQGYPMGPYAMGQAGQPIARLF